MARLWEYHEDIVIIEKSEEAGCVTIAAMLDRSPSAVWARAKKLGVEMEKPEISKDKRFPKVGEKAFIVTATKWLKCLV